MRVLRWIGIILGVLLAGIIVAALIIFWNGSRKLTRTYEVQSEPIAIPTGADAIARGDHIVHHVAECIGCHGENLEGTLLVDDPSFATISAPNLTSGAGGIGASMTDELWVRALRHGIGGDGRGLLIMPSINYHEMREDDLGPLVAYLKQLPPQDNTTLPQRSAAPLAKLLLGAGMLPMQPEIIDHASPPSTVVPGVTPEYGGYLVTLASCRDCHGANLAGGTDPNTPLGPNITTTTVGDWSDEDFLTLMHEGTPPGGGLLSDEMPWKAYGGMTDDELKAIFAYLQTTDRLPTNG